MKFIDDLVTQFSDFVGSIIDRLRTLGSPPDTPANNKASLNPEPLIETPQKKPEKHHVAGTSFHLDAIKCLLKENSAYDWTKKELIDAGRIEERVYKMGPYYGTATLEPEPDNPQDPKAIKVMVEGKHIGYIKSGSCSHIHKLLREDGIEKVKVEIKGGAYKIVLEDYDDYTDKSTYSMERDSFPFCATIILNLK